jgi:hypothetical protein
MNDAPRWRAVERKAMPPDETDTFPEELKLENFARLRCRSAWSAYETAKGEIPADAGGSRRLAGDYHSSVTNVGWLAPRNQIDPQIAKVRARMEQAWRALCDNVIKELKSGAFDLKGVPRGEYAPVIIWSGLLSSMRIISLKKSIISVEGGRHFESVRVFQKAAAAGALEEPRQRIVHAKHTKRPMGEAIAAALQKYGLELDRKGKTDTAIAHLVAPEFPDRSTERGLDSLRQAIGRHYDRLANRSQNIVPIVRPRR